MATAISGLNPAYIADPSLYTDQLNAQNQQALAQALMEQGLSPMQGTQMAGNVALRNSPYQSMAKIAQLLSGQNLQQTANQTAGQAMMRQNAAMASMFGAGDPSQSGQSGQQTPQGPSQGQSPQGSASPAGALGLPGMSPMQAYTSYAMDPSKYMDAYLKGYTPNDTTVQARQAGVDPMVANRLALIKASTDPKILGMQQAGMSPEMIYQAVFGEAAKNAEIDRKAANQFYNPMLNQSGMVPKLAENANPTGAPNANGAIPGVSQIPGSIGVVGNNQAAESSARTDNTIHTITGPGGQQISGRGASILPQGPVVSGPTATDAAVQKTAADAVSNAPAVGVQAKQSITGLENALGIVEQGLTTGQGTKGPMNTLAVLNNLGLPIGKSDAENYQTLQKYLQNSLNAAAQGTGATGSDARFDSFMHGQPNAETMTGKPLANAIRYVLSQQDAALAKSNYISKTYPQLSAKGDPNAAITTQQTWTGLAQPRFFEIQRMAPTEQAAAVNALSPKDAQKFIQWRSDLSQYQ